MKISQEPLGIFENRKKRDNPHTQDYLLSPIYKLPLKNGRPPPYRLNGGIV